MPGCNDSIHAVTKTVGVQTINGCEQLAQSRRTQPRPGRGSNWRRLDRKSDAPATVSPRGRFGVGAIVRVTYLRVPACAARRPAADVNSLGLFIGLSAPVSAYSAMGDSGVPLTRPFCLGGCCR